MANKQYISPIRLFDYCSIPVDGEINIGRIKKQLNVEFDLAADGFIEIDGYHYNKHDVFEELEKPDFISRMAYHRKIWRAKSILQVLENNSVILYDFKQDIAAFEHDPDFDAIFSPYFALPYNHISRGYLNDNNLQDIATWLLYEDFLQADDRVEGFRALRVFLEENVRIFKNISTENYKSFRPKIMHWIKPDWDEFLNNLPEEFFYFKNDLAVELINLTVKIQKTNKKDCKVISNNLMGMRELSSDLHDTIYNNNKVYNQPVSTKLPGSWIIWAIFIVLKIIFSGGCN